MITVKISNGGKETRIRFTCTEKELSRKLEGIGAYGKQAAPHFYLEEVTVPKELVCLEGMYADLDALNYLAKRLDGMDGKEMGQFFAAMETEAEWNLKGLINLTFNLPRYTVVRYQGKCETLYLPEEELSLKKSLFRMGAESFSDCAFHFEGGTLNRKEWLNHIQKMAQSDGIYEINEMLRVLQGFSDDDWDKLTALYEYAGTENAAGVTRLAEHMEQFVFLQGVDTVRAVGHFLIQQGEEWEADPALEPFLDLERFGVYVSEERHGRFVSGGFVYYSGPEDVEEVLGWLKRGDGPIMSGGM